MLLMSCVYPGLGDPPGGWEAPTSGTRGRAQRRPRSVAALAAVLAGKGTHEVVDTAEQVLQGARIGESSQVSVVAALATLIYDDRLSEAARWCEPLLAAAASRRSPLWHAVLAAVRGLIAFRQGDLAAAATHADVALDRISPPGWGIGIGLPRSVAVLAATATGRYEEAAVHLGAPVPKAMFRTLIGVHYLQARGRYLLATRQPRTALADFAACREWMDSCRFDAPGLMSWRTDLAQAHLALSDTATAARLVDAQLAVVRPGPSRTKGIALRVKAMTAEVGCRREALTQAVHTLEQCGDRHELVLALSALSRTQHALGAHEQALTSARMAHRLRRQSLGGRGAPPAVAGLTESELKVATLAARGQTNREIAAMLAITVSTVEQHLTRVYRKLGIRRRADLGNAEHFVTTAHATGE